MDKKKNETGLTLLATKLKTEEAEAFRELAAKNNTTVSRMLSEYIKASVEKDAKQSVSERTYTGTNAAVLTYRNVDRLKHEVAFHNPNHYNPNEMLNHILNQYFKMADQIRRTTTK